MCGMACMKITALINSFSKNMITISGYIGALAVAVMAFSVSYEVVLRYFLNSPTIWSVEVSRFCTVYAFFMGLAYTLRDKSHINVEIVTKYLPAKGRAFFEIVTNSIGVILSLLFVVEGWKMFYEAYEFSFCSMEVLRTPMVIPYFCIPWGGFWLAVQYLFELKGSIQQLQKGEI